MSRIRFNHVFVSLVTISGLSAFVIPDKYTVFAKGKIDRAFEPISVPVMNTGRWVRDRVAPEQKNPVLASNQPKTVEQLQAENERLRLELTSLTVQLEQLKQLNADREMLGVVRQYCVPVQVTGEDAGTAESLSLQGTVLEGLSAGTPVVYRDGIVGKIAISGVGGARVRLITDKNFTVTGQFRRFLYEGDQLKPVPIATPQPSVVGDGRGRLVITNLPVKDVQAAGLQAGDWVMLDDSDWPPLLQGYPLGQIESITQQTNAALFARIVVRPRQELRRLREVMVMIGKPLQRTSTTATQ